MIITYGRVVTEALAAEKKLRAQGIECGIILLETLKPYSVPAERIASWLPSGPCAVIFLEEGIKNGGAGMITFDTLNSKHAKLMKNKNTHVLAIDDNFAIRTQDESLYRTAKISANDILRSAVHLLATLPVSPNSDNRKGEF